MRWLRFGRWPSAHDLDLILDADEGTYESFEALVGQLDMEDPDLGRRCIAVNRLPLPEQVVREAIKAADGLPLDAFLSPQPHGFSVAAWIEPPYSVANLSWRATLGKPFFQGAVPLAHDPGGAS